jgi:hypothetical protein
MADYTIRVSFNIRLAYEQLDWAIDELSRHPKDDDYEHDNIPGVVCEKRYAPIDSHATQRETEAEQSVQPACLWIRHDEATDIDALCARLQTIMRQFDIKDRWGFSWSQDCTAPRLDAYLGGACIISQSEIEQMHTGDWLIARGVKA